MASMEKSWHERYNEMKNRHGLKNSDVARITGLSESNIRSQITRPDEGPRRFPLWLKLAITIDEINYNNSNPLNKS